MITSVLLGRLLGPARAHGKRQCGHHKALNDAVPHCDSFVQDEVTRDYRPSWSGNIDTLLRRYLSSTDHKVIGLLYGFTSLFFLLVGFVLALISRWQLAYADRPVPVIGGLLGDNAPGGILLPEFYNSLGAMHGTIMVFLGVVPLAVGAFGNYVVPLQIGAPDMGSRG
jgi:hypothetical protein